MIWSKLTHLLFKDQQSSEKILGSEVKAEGQKKSSLLLETFVDGTHKWLVTEIIDKVNMKEEVRHSNRCFGIKFLLVL